MKEITTIALIPHNNLLIALQKEQRALCVTSKLLPLYPLICPLDFLSDETNSGTILANYQKTFQHDKPIFTLNLPHFIEAAPYHILARTVINGSVPIREEKMIKIGFFTLCTGNFLYGTALFDPQKEFLPATQNADSAIISGEQSVLNISVFRLTVMSLCITDGTETDTPPGVTWKEGKSLWIKTRHTTHE